MQSETTAVFQALWRQTCSPTTDSTFGTFIFTETRIIWGLTMAPLVRLFGISYFKFPCAKRLVDAVYVISGMEVDINI